mgnify:CR=1 FL=1
MLISSSDMSQVALAVTGGERPSFYSGSNFSGLNFFRLMSSPDRMGFVVHTRIYPVSEISEKCPACSNRKRA